MTQEEINELSSQSFLRGEIENRRDFSVGFKAAQRKLYSKEEVVKLFDILIEEPCVDIKHLSKEEFKHHFKCLISK